MTDAIFTYDELQKKLGGVLRTSVAGAGRGQAIAGSVSGFCADSRLAKPGDLFFPLQGARTNGHEYIRQAVAAGCRAVVVNQAYYRKNPDEIHKLVDLEKIQVFPVVDVLGALHVLARTCMQRYEGVRIGISGSNGKTTTKELLVSVLSVGNAVFFTPGNYNSVIGIPLVIPGLSPHHKYAVFEMAMSEKGEMRKLADLVNPGIGLLTGIGTAHIGNLGSQNAVAEEKIELFRNFLPDSIAVLPENDVLIRRYLGKIRGRRLYFGPGSTPGFEGVLSEGLGEQVFRWRGRKIRLKLNGGHNLANALSVISVADALGIPDEQTSEGLSNYTPVFGRGQIVKTGSGNLVLDCYNANPESMESSLRAFMALNGGKGRRVLVLADMKELGRFSAAAHAALGELVNELGPDLVLLFGEEIEEAARVLAKRGWGERLVWTSVWEEFERAFVESLKPGDNVLLKGSRSMGLERLEKLAEAKREVH